MRARASGYHRTYFNTQNLNISALVRYPDLEAIEKCAHVALEEAESLVRVPGIDPLWLRGQRNLLPSLSSLAPQVASTMDNDSSSEASDDGSIMDNDDDDSNSVIELRQLVENALTHAALALDVNDHMRMYVRILLRCPYLLLTPSDPHRASLPELTDEQDDELFSHAYEGVNNMRTIIRQVKIDKPNPPRSLASSIAAPTDLRPLPDSLIEIRLSHQIAHASRAIRIRNTPKQNDDGKQPPRRKLITAFYEARRMAEERGVGTGVARALKWTGSFATACTGGNAANAELAATAAAKAVSTEAFHVYPTQLSTSVL